MSEVEGTGPVTVRSGEKITVVQTHADTAGELMYRGTFEWFGFKNPEANEFILALTQAAKDVCTGLAESKAQKEKQLPLPPPLR